jgi:hypothetical protein
LPHSRVSDHSWTVSGIISAAITGEALEVYLHGRMGKSSGEIEDAEEYDPCEIEQYGVLQRSIELAMTYNMTHEIRTILGLE